MMIRTLHGLALPAAVQQDLRVLLDDAFPGLFEGRIFFKQVPHARLVVEIAGRLVGQLGLDYRMIRIGDEVVPICGIIDLCVGKDCRGHGLGSALLVEAERQARRAGACFMVLMADRQDCYRRNGFCRVPDAMTRWLAIEDLASHSVVERDLSDVFMVKRLTDRDWPEGRIDMLGYLF